MPSETIPAVGAAQIHRQCILLQSRLAIPCHASIQRHPGSDSQSDPLHVRISNIDALIGLVSLPLVNPKRSQNIGAGQYVAKGEVAAVLLIHNRVALWEAEPGFLASRGQEHIKIGVRTSRGGAINPAPYREHFHAAQQNLEGWNF